MGSLWTGLLILLGFGGLAIGGYKIWQYVQGPVSSVKDAAKGAYDAAKETASKAVDTVNDWLTSDTVKETEAWYAERDKKRAVQDKKDREEQARADASFKKHLDAVKTDGKPTAVTQEQIDEYKKQSAAWGNGTQPPQDNYVELDNGGTPTNWVELPK